VAIKLIRSKGETKVVNQGEVERYTSCGWRLLAVVEESETQTQTSYGSDGQRDHVNVVQVARYILERDEESALSRSQAEAQRLERDVYIARDAGRKAASDMAKAEERCEMLERQLKETRDRVVELRKETDKLHETKRNMERDLSRARSHFGRKAWDEALG
jgi:predicted  nucleic acid-binding Zn-ribbon protein